MLHPKRFRIDGRREYSPLQIDKLITNLGSVLEVSTLYVPKEDSTAKRSIYTIVERSRTACID